MLVFIFICKLILLNGDSYVCIYVIKLYLLVKLLQRICNAMCVQVFIDGIVGYHNLFSWRHTLYHASIDLRILRYMHGK